MVNFNMAPIWKLVYRIPNQAQIDFSIIRAACCKERQIQIAFLRLMSDACKTCKFYLSIRGIDTLHAQL